MIYQNIWEDTSTVSIATLLDNVFFIINHTHMEFGLTKVGRRIDAESPEVIAYLEQYPDVNLDAAIGSVILKLDEEAEESEAPVEATEEAADPALAPEEELDAPELPPLKEE